MKKLWFLLIVFILLVAPIYALQEADTVCNAVTSTGACDTMGLSEAKSMITCAFSGTATTTIDVDIEGSLDSSTWDDMITGVSATSTLQSSVDRPFLYYRATVNTLDSGNLTVKCIPK